MKVQEAITGKLAEALTPAHLEVLNESHMHSVPPGSESHFKVTIVSNLFQDQMLIKRHRMINKTLAQELNQIHALALHTLTPEEWRAREGSVADSPKCRGGGKNQ